jgi:Gram-negative bacterial TonB protein C-terminal
MRNLIIALCFTLGLFVAIKADTWTLPTEKSYCSENKKYCLKVKPKELKSQLSYFQDKEDGKENAGADKNVKDNYCEGVFSSKGKKLWKMRLDNEVAPVSALISDNGDYVITFDNWHGVGYGDNVVAIYDGSSGKLIKKMGLDGFLTESDIYNLPASTSSIQWHGTHQIDYGKKQLILKVVKPGKKEEFFDVHVDLTNGAVLDEIVDRFPSPQFILLTKETETNPVNPVKQSENLCEYKEPVTEISIAELNGKIIQKQLPEYPPAARAVRAVGESVFEVIIAPNGEVECVNPISGHPLLRATLINSIKKWQFEKSQAKYKGKIIIEGNSFLVLNGKVIDSL